MWSWCWGFLPVWLQLDWNVSFVWLSPDCLTINFLSWLDSACFDVIIHFLKNFISYSGLARSFNFWWILFLFVFIFFIDLFKWNLSLILLNLALLSKFWSFLFGHLSSLSFLKLGLKLVCRGLRWRLLIGFLLTFGSLYLKIVLACRILRGLGCLALFGESRFETTDCVSDREKKDCPNVEDKDAG